VLLEAGPELYGLRARLTSRSLTQRSHRRAGSEVTVQPARRCRDEEDSGAPGSIGLRASGGAPTGER